MAHHFGNKLADERALLLNTSVKVPSISALTYVPSPLGRVSQMNNSSSLKIV